MQGHQVPQGHLGQGGTQEEQQLEPRRQPAVHQPVPALLAQDVRPQRGPVLDPIRRGGGNEAEVGKGQLGVYAGEKA